MASVTTTPSPGSRPLARAWAARADSWPEVTSSTGSQCTSRLSVGKVPVKASTDPTVTATHSTTAITEVSRRGHRAPGQPVTATTRLATARPPHRNVRTGKPEGSTPLAHSTRPARPAVATPAAAAHGSWRRQAPERHPTAPASAAMARARTTRGSQPEMRETSTVSSRVEASGKEGRPRAPSSIFAPPLTPAWGWP